MSNSNGTSDPAGQPDPKPGPDLTKRDGAAAAETSRFGTTPEGWSRAPADGDGSPEQFAPTQFGVPSQFDVPTQFGTTPTPAPDNPYGQPGAPDTYGLGGSGSAPYSPSPYTPPAYTPSGYNSGPYDPGPYGAPGYGPSPYAYGAQPTNNGKAIGSLVCGIVAVVGLTFCLGALVGIPEVILGPQAKREIAASGGTQTGDGMATAGIVLGWISIGLTAALVAFFVVVGAFG